MANNALALKLLKLQPQSKDPVAPQVGDFFFADGTSRNAGFYQYTADGWTAVGTGSGGASSLSGINFFPNGTFDTDASGVSSYEDGGSYVDGTGGSPATLSFSWIDYTDSLSLEGLGSLKISKAATDGSGEGITLTTNPIGSFYQNDVVYGSFSYNASDSNYTEDDLEITAYDINTGTELTVEGFGDQDTFIKKVAKGKKLFKVFTNGTTRDIRISLHLASDSATSSAWAISIDEFKLGVDTPILGPIVTDTGSYVPTLNSTTNVSLNSGTFWQVGSRLLGSGTVKWSGVGAASDFSFTLPSGYQVDPSKIPSTSANETVVGSADWFNNGVSWRLAQVVYNTSTSTFNLVIEGGGSQFFSNQAGSGDFVSWNFNIPILNASTGVSYSNSSTFNVSQFLATGTRVTGSAPTKLGEYRSYLRQSSSLTYSETNGDPTASPTAANGILLYGNSTGYSTTDSNNSPSRYDIYVGKNKQVKFVFFQNTGRTGLIYVDPSRDSTNSRGVDTHYDPTTGIATVRLFVWDTATANCFAGYDNAGFSVLNTYFDIVVAENAQAVGLDLNDIPIKNTLYVKDIKANNTAGGTFTSGAWQTRDLNTIENPFSLTWASLSTNQITLAKGTYRIKARAPGYAVSQHKARFQNITAGSTTILGSNAYSDSSASSDSVIEGIFSIASTTTFEVQHYCSVTEATDGFGNNNNLGGTQEVYTEVEIERIS